MSNSNTLSNTLPAPPERQEALPNRIPSAPTQDAAVAQADVYGTLPVKAKKQAALEIASELRDIVERCDLAVDIQGRKYVRCEGWQTLGAFFGLVARETEHKPIQVRDTTGWEVRVDVYRWSDGAWVTGAWGLCTRDEVVRKRDGTIVRPWENAPEYAVRSMASTRAAAKAFRTALAWVMTLAKFAPTPAEEMDGVVDVAATVTPRRPSQPAQKQNAQQRRRPTAQKPQPQQEQKLTADQRKLADTIVQKIRAAYPEIKSSEEFREKCRLFLHSLTEIDRPENVPDDLARETEQKIRDWAPDIVRMTVDVPF